MRMQEQDKKVIGFYSTCGDLLHTGHLAAIQESAMNCDYLMVGLICDPTDRPTKHKPVESVFERYMRLASNKWIDEVIPLQGEEDLDLALATLPIDVRFLGEEYRDKNFTGKKTCEERGIKCHFLSRYHSLSSSSLRERAYEAEKKLQEEVRVDEPVLVSVKL